VATPAVQLPAPSQPAALVCEALAAPFAQLALRQIMPPPGYVQAVALAAVHCPPHVDPTPAQPERPPCGLPAGTCAHVPSDAVRSQAMHCSVQGALQHTPSTQKPDWHWLAPWQGRPLPIGPHDPPPQAFGWTHSEVEPQRSAQPLPSGRHMKGAHDSAAPAAAQAPKPSQWASWTNVLLPLSQDASPQTVVASYTAQCPSPSQSPLVPQLCGDCVSQASCTGALPRATATQLPTLSGRLHA
jgi:hypothetical protein